ncbi:excisionase family DNA-binding protein [Myceligenerans indicum]|uniref:Excisionase family DNA-binding protein n=1 Tax=Myceligenerans indicum TaxID=2593663 RepID=A0ABS1LS17_9MICO|nr:excisionase family DNA-binding protein [Myceligenerans indicum]MBL0888859.1 excisionase family DNA-binding protein [Myceligenerans indicum]
MTDILAHDSEALRGALATPGDDDVEVTLSLPRSTAARILMLLEAELHGGAWVLPMEEDLTTTQAARALGVSRPHLVELLKNGAIEHHKVGTHRRVPVAALHAYKAERDRRHAALKDLMSLSDEIGLDE